MATSTLSEAGTPGGGLLDHGRRHEELPLLTLRRGADYQEGRGQGDKLDSDSDIHHQLY